MKQSVCLATVITPFHLKVAKCLAKDNRLEKPIHLILPASFQLEPEDERLFEINRTFDNDFNSRELRRKPLKVIRQRRADLKDLKKNVSAIFARYADYEIIDLLIFNEKSALAQIAIDEKSRRKVSGSVIAADEGLAFYVEDNLKASIKKLIYPIVTRLLLGFRYQYFMRAGVHKSIDTVYMRYPDLINKKNKQYYTFSVTEKKQIFELRSNKVLLLTSPYSDYGMLSVTEEAHGVHAVVGTLLEFGYEVVIKPHPFERQGKFSELEGSQVTRVSGKTITEEMNLAPFTYIVNFGSSAIMDILDRGFPRENIITYAITNFNIPFFESLKIARSKDELRAILTALAQQPGTQPPG